MTTSPQPTDPVKVGAIFGAWTVVTVYAATAKHESKALCRCICEDKFVVAAEKLRAGTSRSCGCTRSQAFLRVHASVVEVEPPAPVPPLADPAALEAESLAVAMTCPHYSTVTIGRRYHELTITSLPVLRPEPEKYASVCWWVTCQCSCGKSRECRSAYLRQGFPKDCGCGAGKNKPAPLVGVPGRVFTYARPGFERLVRGLSDTGLLREAQRIEPPYLAWQRAELVADCERRGLTHPLPSAPRGLSVEEHRARRTRLLVHLESQHG